MDNSDDSSRDEPRLAISNAKRHILAGPQFLDHVLSNKDDKVAIDHVHSKQFNQRITYQRLKGLTELLKREITRLLCEEKEDTTIVPIIIPQQPALYLSYLAVLGVGAAFCPVTPETPDERIRFIIDDVGASLLLCLPELVQRFQVLLPNVECLAVDLAALLRTYEERAEDTPLDQTITSGRKSSDIAYVMYTSGSTGKPKGVQISHHAITQSLLAHDEHVPPFERFLQFAAPTFDVSIFEIFFTWLRGSTLVSCDRESMLADLPMAINSQDVDAVELTPTVATTLLRTRSATPHLKLILTIGEMLTNNVVREFGATDTEESILYAMYGPTEAAVHCTILPKMKTSDKPNNIGQPLSTVTAFILSETSTSDGSQILETNEVGELAVAGQLADGYLNRPDQTSTAFINLPGFDKVYRTGDRALMTKDGHLHILGRISAGQVKIRGQRVELGEIEEAAYRTDGVSLAVAMLIEQSIVLFCSGTQYLTVKVVEERCKAWLPQHMRPSHIIVSDTGLPRLDSGKVDRKALQKMFEEWTKSREGSSVDPVSTTESSLLEVFEAELQTPIALKASLWTCGLDSLRAIRIASKLRSKFDTISVPLILEADSVANLANDLESTQAESSLSSSVEDFDDSRQWQNIKRRVLENESQFLKELEVECLQPCSAMQIAMLSETFRNPVLNYNEVQLSCDPSISFDSVVKAFQIVADKNSILRSGFIHIDELEMPFVQVTKRTLCWQGSVSLAEPLKLRQEDDDETVTVHIHHAIYDGWSWDLIVSDINAILSDTSTPDRSQFTDFRKSQQRQATLYANDDLTKWVDYLRDIPSSTLPALNTNFQRNEGREQAFLTLSTSLKECEQAAQNLHVNTAAIVHSAVSWLLGAYLDSGNIITGLVSAGRDSMPFVEDVIGPCLSMLPVAIRLDQMRRVSDLVRHVYAQHIYCLRHAKVSLAQIQSALNRREGHSLFDFIFVWQQSVISSLTNHQPVRTISTYDNLNFAMVCEVEPLNELVYIKTTFDRCRWPLDQVNFFHQQLDLCIGYIVQNLSANLADLYSRLPQSMLSVANTDYMQLESEDVASTIARHAQQNPEKLAVDFIEEFDPINLTTMRTTLTYKELHSRSTTLSWRFQHHYHLSKDDIIAVCAPKSVGVYTLICGIVTAGCAYLCIDHNTPKARAREILNEAKCKLVISSVLQQEDIADFLLLTFNDIFDGIRSPVDNICLQPSVHPSDLAYAVFTSGSTGIPKGVLLTRENLMTNLHHLEQVYPHNSTSRLLQSCSLAFDVSVFEIFWTWYCGLTLCSTTNDVLFQDLEAFIDAQDISHLSMTPSVAALVDPYKVPKVEFLVCAGEPMSAKVFEAWAGHGLHQGYGPSETTNICNVRNYVKDMAPINVVGPPFPNTSLFVCQRQPKEDVSRPITLSDFSPVPRGGVGEIWIGGMQVGRGYTDPSLTSRSWFDHPNFGRLYRSGDIGRLLADDSLMILGREDDQTKIRGHRIDLVEINLRLMQSELVSDAVAILVKDAADNDRLIAFCMLRRLGSDEKKEVIMASFRQLQEVLPSYMIPELLLPIASIPLTRQGKVDKRELQKRYSVMTDEERSQYTADATKDFESALPTGEELAIADAISSISKIPIASINPHASLFTYGIDSIAAITLSRRLRENGFVDIDASSIMRHSSIKRLLSSIETHKQTSKEQATKHSIYKIVPESVQRTVHARLQKHGAEVQCILPCTSIQEAVLASSDKSESGSYLNHIKYRVSSNLREMRHAWTLLAERHQVLRTTFVLTDSANYPYVQAVFSAINVPWLTLEQPDARQLSAISGNLFYQIQVIPRNVQVFEMHLLIHHALYDAEALYQIQDEIELICRGMQLPSPIAFSKYLEFGDSVDFSSCKRYWRRVLRSVVPCCLGQRFRLVKDSTTKAVVVKDILSLPLSQIQNAAHRTVSTLLAILQTALAKLLSQYLQTNDLCFGTVFSGRNLPIAGVEHIVGPCFNTLPSRAYLKHNTTNTDLIQNFQRFNIESLAFQTSSIRQLQRDYSPDGRALYDVLLLLQSTPRTLDEKIWQMIHEEGQMDFPFIFEAIPDPRVDKLHLHLHSNTAHDRHLRSILTDLGQVIEHVTMSPNALAAESDLVLKALPDSPKFDRILEPSQRIRAQMKPSMESDCNTVAMQMVVDSITKLTQKSSQDLDSDLSVFRLGFDSITVVQLASDLRSRGVKISAADILENPRISEIASFCTNDEDKNISELDPVFDLEKFDLQHRKYILDLLGCANAEIQAIWPCTSTQIGIISEHLQFGGRIYYNEIKLRLQNDANISKLRFAFQQAMENHIMLRTGFAEVEDPECPYAMVIYTAENAKLPWVNSTKPGSRSSMNSQTIRALASPPWQIEISNSSDHKALSLRLLHALYDAKSLDIILSDVVAAYYNRTALEVLEIHDAVSAIVSQNRSTVHATKALDMLQRSVEPTIFPDLNIVRSVSPQLLVSSIEISMISSDMQEACKSLDITLWIACQIAWARLLAAYCGQSRVTFGAVLAGRDFKDDKLNNVAFPCMNTVPMAYDLSQSETELIAFVKQYTGELLKNQHISMPKIKAALELDREVFNSLLVLQNFKSQSSQSAPWTVESDQASAEYKLSLEVLPCQDRINLQLTYNTSHLPPEHSTILLHQFEESLYQVLRIESCNSKNDHALISALPPKQPRIPSQSRNLPEMVMNSAMLHPNKIALRFVTNIEEGTSDSTTWTYAEMMAKASSVADLLSQNGAVTTNMIAICFDKCPEASFALLGVLMAGCAYVAIDPSAPTSRKEFILNDSKSRIVLASHTTAPLFENMNSVETLILDDAQLDGFGDMQSQQMSLLKPDDICYCLYTSGTTGEPKGCLISHDSVVQAMLSFSRIFEGRWTPESRWLQFASYNFDVSVLEHFWSWSEGLCVTVVPQDLLFEDIPRAITTLGITHLDLTPSLARLLSPENAPSLCNGVFIVGGEQIGQNIVERWGDAGCLYNFYGPSEVTIGCTVHPRVPANVKPSNIGQQWDNVGSLVLDPVSEQPVLIGAVGELCLSGLLVGKGYLNRAEMTEKKFVTLQKNSERVYRTGDLVRMLHDHSFDFLGRIDDQIKLRGQRLEVGEINHILLHNSDGITDVATLVLTHPEQAREHLVSFLARARHTTTESSKPQIVDNASTTGIHTAIRKQATTHLPAYMVPTYFLLIDFLPLTANNKADSKTLRHLYQSVSLESVRAQQILQRPASKFFKRQFRELIQTIANFLKVDSEEISDHSSLFQLGMDSIRAISLSRTLKAAGYTNASVPLIMKHPVVSDLIGVLDRENDLERPSARSTKSSIFRINDFTDKHFTTFQVFWKSHGKSVKHVCPCTPLQEGMISRMLKSSNKLPHYLIKFVYRLRENTDISRLTKAWHDLQHNLDILRTYFMATHDGYAQVILHENENAVSHDSVGNLDTFSPFDLIDRNFEQWSQQSRNLEQALPWKIWLIANNDDQPKYMALFMFHGLYDGNSLSLLLDALFQQYSHSLLQENQAPQFHTVLSHGPLLQLDDATDFWRRYLPEMKLLNLSREHDDTAMNNTNTLHRVARTVKVADLSSQLGVTPHAVLCATWLYCLAQCFRVNPAIGLVLSGRSIELENADKIIGPMFNTVPFMIDESSQNVSLTDLVKTCHDRIVELMPYQHSSLREIRKWTKMSPGSEPFDSIFVYQDSRHMKHSQHDWPWVQEGADNIVDYPLNVEIERMAEDDFSITIAMLTQPEYSNTPMNLMDTLTDVLDRVLDADQISLPSCLSRNQLKKVSKDSINYPQNSAHGRPRAFIWTIEAKIIRAELASLAQVQEATIDADEPSIFELGLDSIDALKLAARLKSKEVKMPVSKILQFPSIQGMIEQWTTLQNHKNKSSSVSKDHKNLYIRDIQPTDDKEKDAIQAVLPTTSLQEGMLLHYEQYFHILSYQLCQYTDTQRLVTAINQTIYDLPILRTRFHAIEIEDDDSQFLQIIEHSSGWKSHTCELLDLNDVSTLKHYLTTKREQATLMASTPYIAVATLKDSTSYLVIALSHASYDAWSLSLLHNHIYQLYHGHYPGDQDVQTTTKHVQDVRETGRTQSTIDFWSGQVDSIQSTTVPSSNESDAVATVRSVVSGASFRHAQSTCRRFGVTMQSLGLAAWSLTLATMIKQLDVIFGVVMSGRTSEETQQLVFPTFNTVVFRPNVRENMDKEQVLRRIHQLSVQVFEYQDLPLSKALQLAGKQDRELFNSLFTFQKAPISFSSRDPLYEEVDLDSSTKSPPYSINIELEDRNEQLFWTIAVQAGFMSSEEIGSSLNRLDSILLHLVDPNSTTIFSGTGNAVSICNHEPIDLTMQSTCTLASLSGPYTSSSDADSECADLEDQIREVFSEVSNTEFSNVDHQMSLFNLGFDSISAIRVSNALRKKGIRLTVSQILNGQKVHDIALLASKTSNSPNQPHTSRLLLNEQNEGWNTLLSTFGVKNDDADHVLPATGGQTHALDMWHASRKRLFYPCFWLRVNNCNIHTFETAWTELVRQMPLLRTKFGFYNSEYYQIIYKPGILAQTSFPWRLGFAQDQNDLLVAVELHHTLYDAVSFAHMTFGLEKILQNNLAVSTEHRIFGSFINETCKDKIGARAFWMNYLGGGNQVNFEGRGTFEAERVSIFKTGILSVQALEEIARREDVSLQAIFFAIVGRIVASLCHKEDHTSPTQDINIGIWLANRSLDLDRLPDLAYPTFNIVPLRVAISSGILEVSRKVQRDLQNISRAENCGISLREIYAWTKCRLNCFVNFLKLPSPEDVIQQSSDMNESQSIVKHAEGADKEKAQAMLKINTEEAPSPMVGNTVVEDNLAWCLPALDIEARIDEEGCLAIGLFAPEDLIDEIGLWEIMEDIRKALEEIEKT